MKRRQKNSHGPTINYDVCSRHGLLWCCEMLCHLSVLLGVEEFQLILCIITYGLMSCGLRDVLFHMTINPKSQNNEKDFIVRFAHGGLFHGLLTG
jgi:hypothetical protein